MQRLDRRLGNLVLRDLVRAADVPERLLPVAVEDVRAPLAAVAVDLPDLLRALRIVENAGVGLVVVENVLVRLRLPVPVGNNGGVTRQRVYARRRYQPPVHRERPPDVRGVERSG